MKLHDPDFQSSFKFYLLDGPPYLMDDAMACFQAQWQVPDMNSPEYKVCHLSDTGPVVAFTAPRSSSAYHEHALSKLTATNAILSPRFNLIVRDAGVR